MTFLITKNLLSIIVLIVTLLLFAGIYQLGKKGQIFLPVSMHPEVIILLSTISSIVDIARTATKFIMSYWMIDN